MFFYARNTPEVIGLPQIQRLLPLFANMPRRVWSVDFDAPGGPKLVPGRGFTETRSRIRDWTTRQGVQAEQSGDSISQHDVSIDLFVAKLTNRQAYLTELDRQISAGGAPLLSLRFQVVTELRNATMQYVYNQAPEIAAWLQVLGRWLQAVEGAERERDAAVKAHWQDQTHRKAAIERLPPAQRAKVMAAHERQIAQFRCDEGSKDACAQLRGNTPAGAPAAATKRDPRLAMDRWFGKWVFTQAAQGNAAAKSIGGMARPKFEARANAGEFGDLSVPLKRLDRALIHLGRFTQGMAKMGSTPARQLMAQAAIAYKRERSGLPPAPVRQLPQSIPTPAAPPRRSTITRLFT